MHTAYYRSATPTAATHTALTPICCHQTHIDTKKNKTTDQMPNKAAA